MGGKGVVGGDFRGLKGGGREDGREGGCLRWDHRRTNATPLSASDGSLATRRRVKHRVERLARLNKLPVVGDWRGIGLYVPRG